jgi:hypothetical protein
LERNGARRHDHDGDGDLDRNKHIPYGPTSDGPDGVTS